MARKKKWDHPGLDDGYTYVAGQRVKRGGPPKFPWGMLFSIMVVIIGIILLLIFGSPFEG